MHARTEFKTGIDRRKKICAITTKARKKIIPRPKEKKEEEIRTARQLNVDVLCLLNTTTARTSLIEILLESYVLATANFMATTKRPVFL